MSEKQEELNEEVVKNEEEVQAEEVTVEEETSSEELSVEDKIVELEAKLKESEDKYFRVHADFENIKKKIRKREISSD